MKRNDWTRRLTLAALVAAVTLLAIPASAALQKSGDAQVSFTASATGGLSIKGTTKAVNAGETDSKIWVVANLASLKTGLGLRDKHMRDKLETDKHRDATLWVPRSALSFPEDGKSTNSTATGSLTLHGTTKPVRISYTAERKGSLYVITGQFQIDMRDFGIEPPSYMGLKVKPNVSVNASFQLAE
jgi:polyisoprenoid-binding protein YceI